MAAESTIREMQTKPKKINELVLSNGDLEATDDNFDLINDGNIHNITGNSDIDDDYLDGLDEFQLKDIDPESLALLTSVLYEKDLSACPVSDDDDDYGDKDQNALENLLSSASQVKESEKDSNIDNGEEKAILKEIRDEIERKVRNEMKDELNNYQRRIKAIENGDESEASPFGKNLETEMENMEDMDPKLREAMIKMRKLDKILFEKIQIEKEVKRNRILLEKRMRVEIAEMTKGVNIPQDIKTNTEKFLALEPPPSHNEGITVEDEADLPPVFQTQLEESEALWRKRDGTEKNAKDTETDGTARAESPLKTTSRSGRSQTRFETNDRIFKKDFIKRNKELAGNADQSLPLTDDEKKRLAELLEGIDDLSGPEDGAGDVSESQFNAYQVVLQPGEGYFPDQAEMKCLNNIDDQLKTLMPKEDYMSLLSPRPVPPQPLFSRVGMQTPAAAADLPERFGERVLLETKNERELKARLEAIEQELAKFKARTEEESVEDNHLTEEQLDNLLDQCARNMAMPLGTESPDLSARSVASSRLSLLENPPKLTKEQLEQLLSEAHFPLSSRLQSLREDDENFSEEEDSSETIKAETWKAIKDINLNEPDYLDQKFPTLAEIDRELQSFLDTTYVNLNISNNHNRNISTNNTDSKNHNQHNEQGSGEFVPITSPSNYSAYHFIQSAAYSGSMSSALHGSSGGLPRISQSNGISRSEISVDSRSCAETPIFISRGNSEDMIRLPDISTKSFLVHAYQGVNNANEKDRSNLPMRQPADFVCNDLFDMRIDDISDDRDGEREQGNGCKSSSRNTAGLQPKPPLPKDWQ